MLPTTGDRVAAERLPDRAVPAASDVVPIPAPRIPLRTGTAPCPGERTPAAGAEGGAAGGPAAEARGCLYALSQPPLMLFLLVVGGLLGVGAAYDLIFL
ncbi:hypothetical protein [Streptomyces sp. NRRL F-5123]|uniref:hypothetical protein n=1 Tax=Streptomyces sp. NRRL F-5123 TaxID=1463856 RepID=UPI0005BB3D70|nr:hypothetical protein [Streptomyces sp. NRRL F-5123]